MATFLARITVKPGCEAAFERLAADLYEATHAREPGVRRYEYWRGAEDRTYYCSAAFDDFLAFLAHQTSDHHEELGPQITQTFESIRLEWVDPVAGASASGSTEMQPLPDGATPLEVSYHQRFAADVKDWWRAWR